MKMKLDGMFNDVEFTIDDLREALTDYYLKKAKDDPSLQVTDDPSPTCGVVCDSAYTTETPKAGHLRWVDRTMVTSRCRQNLDELNNAVQSKRYSTYVNVVDQVTQDYVVDDVGGGSCSISGCTMKEGSTTYPGDLLVNEAGELNINRSEDQNSLDTVINSYIDGGPWVPPIAPSPFVGKSVNAQGDETQHKHDPGMCEASGCSNKAWKRPNGETKFCAEHETEEYNYKKGDSTNLLY